MVRRRVTSGFLEEFTANITTSTRKKLSTSVKNLMIYITVSVPILCESRMIRIIALALLSALVPAHALAQSAPPQALGYRLAFSDDFDTLDLSPDGKGVHKWYEGVWFSHHHAPLANIADEQSAVSLTWKRGQEQPDTSIATFSRYSPSFHAWRYGYFEARMKWTPVTGAWPAFWLIPVQDATRKDVYGGVRESGELDIFEGNGKSPQSFFGTIHDWRQDPANPDKMKDIANSGKNNKFPLSQETDFSQYHTYGMLWEPEKITWFFDGKPLHSEKAYVVFDRQDYFLVIGMQEGATWHVGDLTGVTAQQMTLTLDWVRVWQKSQKR